MLIMFVRRLISCNDVAAWHIEIAWLAPSTTLGPRRRVAGDATAGGVPHQEERLVTVFPKGSKECQYASSAY
jgi:hypothetical protein